MPDPTPAPPGVIVRRAREALGWTVYRLAREAGVATSQLYRCESGEAGLTLETARRVCAALGVSLSVFDSPAAPR